MYYFQSRTGCRYSVRKLTSSQNAAGRFTESSCSVLQYRLMAAANLLLFFSVAAKPKAKVNPCDTMISYWLMLQRDTCWKEVKECHTHRGTTASVWCTELLIWLVMILFFWSIGSKLNLGGSSTAAATADARQRMRWEGISVWVMCGSAIYTAMRSASANSSLPGVDRKPTELYSTTANLPWIQLLLVYTL